VRVVVNLIVLWTSHAAVYVTSRAVQRAAIILLNDFIFVISEADASSAFGCHTPMKVPDAVPTGKIKFFAVTRQGTVLKLAIHLQEED
jgi:hypothetical protein